MAKTLHRLINGDARDLSFLPDGSVHLVVTSPPYWNLKEYNEHPDQLGHIQDYEAFLQELHLVFPLHADICVLCRRIGFDNLNPIIWYKIANASYEVTNGSKFLGKPYEPNAIIKNDMEYILMQRKPGGYRKPTDAQRRQSMIDKEDFGRWFQQIWNIPGASLKNHPAPFPLELASRLVRMFSFAEDTVLDPFCGSGTTMIAALKHGRNSIGVEIDPEYCRMAARYLKAESSGLFADAELKFEQAVMQQEHPVVQEAQALYRVRPARKKLEEIG